MGLGRPTTYLTLLLAASPVAPAHAQRTGELLNVFLDCQAPFCDFDHFRREIGFVNWVREREDSGIHLLITAQPTGGGGWQFALAFLGRGAFAGRGDTLTFTSANTDTETEVRNGLGRTIALGLAPYAARTGIAERLSVLLAPGTEIAQAAPTDDPWNFWTFQVGLSGELEGEASERQVEVGGSATASRTTDHLKIQIGLQGNFDRQEFELEDTTIVNTTGDYAAELLTVWSLGPRVSAGFALGASRSTFANRDLAVATGPAIEFNLFPYSESTRQLISVLYRVEGVRFDYEEITVAGKFDELLARHRLSVSAEIQQPWGEIFGSVRGVQYLHDLELHRIDTFAGVEIRIFRGFGVDFLGQVSRIKDQFFLPAGGLTDEEVLLRRRQRETDFSFELSVGFSYRFGSRFANIVNPRFGEGGIFLF